MDYLKNGSAANLNLPVLSEVLYAELVWGGLYKSSATDISDKLNDNVVFGTPTGNYSITSDTLTRQNIEINLPDISLGFYVRSANVTSIVKNAVNGTYFLSSVPALIEAIDSRTADTNHAGWTLAVVYSDNNQPFRSLNLWAGGVAVSSNTGSTDIVLSGFKTPVAASPSGKLYVSAQEGDAVIAGDQMLFGSSTSNLQNLSGSNNPIANFFCSQINDNEGVIDENGTFGTRNANPFTRTNTFACRQGYDITAVDLTGKLNSGQTAALIRFTSTGDLYVPNCLAIQIENGVNPDLEITKTVDKNVAIKDEILTYTSEIKNTGDIILFNTIFQDDIPEGTSFVSGSVFIDSINYPSYNPETGFSLGDIIQNQTISVTFKVSVD